LESIGCIAIVFVPFAALLAIYGATHIVGASRVRENAERYALRYGSRFEGMRRPVAECMGVDNDNNGYVTCTLRDADREMGVQRPRQVECVANVFFEWSTGCREYRLRTLDVQTGGDSP
jgi:hypothetical protein